jgi:hypothetical protein
MLLSYYSGYTLKLVSHIDSVVIWTCVAAVKPKIPQAVWLLFWGMVGAVRPTPKDWYLQVIIINTIQPMPSWDTDVPTYFTAVITLV